MLTRFLYLYQVTELRSELSGKAAGSLSSRDGDSLLEAELLGSATSGRSKASAGQMDRQRIQLRKMEKEKKEQQEVRVFYVF